MVAGLKWIVGGGMYEGGNAMAKKCEKLLDCPFLAKYEEEPVFLSEEFKKFYCAGPLMDKCVRRDHQRIFGSLPSDDLAPSGLLCC